MHSRSSLLFVVLIVQRAGTLFVTVYTLQKFRAHAMLANWKGVFEMLDSWIVIFPDL
jgi:hypothetical protein